MRYPDGHKAETKARIVRAAAEALRRSGLAGVSIPALMKEAGLTHGGFYGYFADRDALVVEALEQTAADAGQGAFAEDLSLEDTLRLYLSEGHVAHPEQGCVVAALGSEGGHQSDTVRGAFAEVARSLLSRVEKKLHPTRDPARGPRIPSDEALRLAATMVGAVILARLVNDDGLARRILRAAARN